MSAAIEAYRSSLNSPKIKGYIQHFEKDISLQISIYSDLQFQCLYRTIYGHRVLHVDATGNLVKVPHHQYKRVLNYSFIVTMNSFIVQIQKKNSKKYLNWLK